MRDGLGPNAGSTQEDRIAAIHHLVWLNHRALNGNGQPGLITRVARLEERTSTKPVIASSVLASLFTAIATVLAAWLAGV